VCALRPRRERASAKTNWSEIAQGAEPIGPSPEQFAIALQSDIAKYARIIKESGHKAEQARGMLPTWLVSCRTAPNHRFIPARQPHPARRNFTIHTKEPS